MLPGPVIGRTRFERSASGYVVFAEVYIKRDDGKVDKLSSERVVGIDDLPNDVQVAFMSREQTSMEFTLTPAQRAR